LRQSRQHSGERADPGFAMSRLELADQPGGIFVRALEQINHEDRVLMQSVARVVLHADAGSLIEQLRAREVVETAPRHAPTRAHEPGPVQNIALPQRMLVNGIGGFSRDAREYVIATDALQRTPAPWINVIANPHFGCLVSESGSGYTWFQNAHEYRLTPWSDDPVSDPNTEAFYVRDEDSGHFWSPTPLPRPGAARYLARHGHEPKNRYGESLFQVTVKQGLDWARRQRRGEVLDVVPRYNPRWSYWLTRVPLLRELVTWNLVIVVRKA
jgi:cellobiose phosphorylase